MDKIIQLARDLGSQIQKEEAYIEMMKKQEINDKNEELQQMIGEFNLKRMSLGSEMGKKEEEKDKAKMETLDKEIRDMYQKIMACEGMQEYSKSKREVDLLMANIYKILAAAIGGQDPQTFDITDNGSSCGAGGCESCSGCH